MGGGRMARALSILEVRETDGKCREILRQEYIR